MLIKLKHNIAIFIIVLLSLPLCYTASSYASRLDKQGYLVKVGNKVITSEEFFERIDNLHKSRKVGRALSNGHSFEAMNYTQYLDDLIDEKLMVIEAERMGFDEAHDIKSKYRSIVLNYILPKLRQTEIFDKVSVSEEELLEYYEKELSGKKQEEKDEANSEVIKKVELDPKRRAEIKKRLLDEKIRARQKEYFEAIKAKAVIEIDEDLLKRLQEQSIDSKELIKTLIIVNGEPIKGFEFFQKWQTSDKTSKTASQIIDRLILYRAMDQEALASGYQDEGDLKKKITKKYEGILIDEFKKRVISPLVKVKEQDIKKYYEDKKERYKESDHVKLKVLTVEDPNVAEELAEELRMGADFEYLAREQSIDPLKMKGGNVGWILQSALGDAIKMAADGAKYGDILGPFKTRMGTSIFMFLDRREGNYKDFSVVKISIESTIGGKLFEDKLEEYLSRFRDTIHIDINSKEFKKFEGI